MSEIILQDTDPIKKVEIIKQNTGEEGLVYLEMKVPDATLNSTLQGGANLIILETHKATHALVEKAKANRTTVEEERIKFYSGLVNW